MCAQVLRQQVAKGEALCAIFIGPTAAGVTTPSLLVPTIDTLSALLDGPRSAPYREALLELSLIMPCRHAHPFPCHLSLSQSCCNLSFYMQLLFRATWLFSWNSCRAGGLRD